MYQGNEIVSLAKFYYALQHSSFLEIKSLFIIMQYPVFWISLGAL